MLDSLFLLIFILFLCPVIHRQVKGQGAAAGWKFTLTVSYIYKRLSLFKSLINLQFKQVWITCEKRQDNNINENSSEIYLYQK